jgi:hypothetical protein
MWCSFLCMYMLRWCKGLAVWLQVHESEVHTLADVDGAISLCS